MCSTLSRNNYVPVGCPWTSSCIRGIITYMYVMLAFAALGLPARRTCQIGVFQTPVNWEIEWRGMAYNWILAS